MAMRKAAPEGAKETGVKKGKILIVEDDLFLVKTYQITLEREGFEVWVASDGKEALSFFEKDPADVMLLDLMLPGISGFDILFAMKKSEKWKSVPVLILSNLGQAEDIARGKAMGATDYIVKANVRVNEVIRTIAHMLNGL